MQPITKRLNGSCLCGEVSYIVDHEFKYALICHCSRCRRATGSAFKPFGGIERAKLDHLPDGSLKYALPASAARLYSPTLKRE